MRYKNIYITLGILVLLLLSFKVGVTTGISMEPYLLNNQAFLYTPLARTPHVNDVVLLTVDNEKLIKRVIGTPGDLVMLLDGKVVGVDGDIFQDVTLSLEQLDAITFKEVSPKHYYVIGDNQGFSVDSREFGEIPTSAIQGYVLLKLW